MSDTVATQLAPLTATDIDDADDLLRRAFAVSVSFRQRLVRYIELGPSWWFTLRGPSGMVGMVGANVFPGCAYIGLMAVAPTSQRQGHGELLMRALLSRLEEGGHVDTALDASDLGAPLYRRLGFVDAGLSAQWDRVGSPHATSPSSSLSPDIFGVEPPVEYLRLADATARGELAQLDARCFGHDRRLLWERLAREQPEASEACLATRDAHGELTGYLLLQSGLIGPWGAVTAAAAASLVRRALTDPRLPNSARVLVSGANTTAARLLEAAGFQKTRHLQHMRRLASQPTGYNAPEDRWPHIYGKGSFCLG